ncbi:hypothetical protein AALD01_07960 [Oscillospiraceae bacterium 21-37]
MNIASFVAICIIVGLLILAVVFLRKTPKNQCDGNCSGCAFQCNKK